MLLYVLCNTVQTEHVFKQLYIKIFFFSIWPSLLYVIETVCHVSQEGIKSYNVIKNALEPLIFLPPPSKH